MADPAAPHTNLVRFLPYAGAVMVLVLVAGWFTVLGASQTHAFAILAGLATLFYGGKEAGLPVGMAAGADPYLLGAFVFLADAAATCFIYPPIHYAIRNWLEREGLVGDYLRFLRRKTAGRQRLVANYGAFGLLLFMLIPFAINGPLVGAILGRLMGLRARQIVPTLTLAIGITTVFWTGVYALGFEFASKVDPVLPKLIGVLVLLLVLAHAVVAFWQLRRERRGPGAAKRIATSGVERVQPVDLAPLAAD